MSITEIKARLANETKVHEAALRIREILDSLEGIDLSDDRDPQEVCLALVNDD